MAAALRLSAEQRAAAADLAGPLRVVAGAGTGKTAVIAERFRRLVRSGAGPGSILVLTFTDRAAEEMRERILGLVPEAEPAQIGTFHAQALAWLREDGARVGLRPGFRILTGPERWISLRELMWELGDEAFIGEDRPDDLVGPLIKLQERLKQELVPLARLADWALRNAADPRAEALGAAARLFRVHADRCRQQGLVDFDDLLVGLVRLFERHPEVRRRYAARFPWLMVDEYQDSNLAQERVVELLAGPGGNVCVVGDDDQSIYRFRGASRASMERFLRCFPTAVTRTLGRNRRSSSRVVAAARSLIEENPDRVPKPLRAHPRRGAGPAVEVWTCDTGSDEAAAIARAARLCVESGTPLSEIAVLTRTHAVAQPLVEALRGAGLPVHHHGARGLLQRPEIRDVVAYLRLLHDPGDLLALARLLRRPPLHCDLAPVLAGVRGARAESDGAGEAGEPGSAADGPEWRALAGMEETAGWAGTMLGLLELKARLGMEELLFELLHRTRHLELLAEPGSEEAVRAAANVGRFYELAAEWSERRADRSLGQFMAYLELVERSGLDLEEAPAVGPEDAVQVMTIHQAKGLEFDTVFVPAAVEGRLPQPHRTSGLDLPVQLLEAAVRGREDQVAEERRLAYVALTRARRRVVLSWARRYEGSRPWRPSRFLDELGRGVLRRELAPGEGDGRAAAASRSAEGDAARIEPDSGFPELSFSGISAYRECPRSYWFRYRLRLPAPAGVEAQFGSILHLALQRAARRRQEGRLSAGDLEAAYLGAWEEVGLSEPRRGPALRRLGRSMLQSFFAAGGLEHPAHLLEVPFAARLDGWTLRGVIDRVDELAVVGSGSSAPGWRLIDYKTGRPQPAGRLRRDLQLALYALGAHEALGFDEMKLEIVYLRDGRRVTLDADGGLLAEARRIGDEVAAGVRAGRFEPSPQRRRCSLCAYRLACEAAL